MNNGLRVLAGLGLMLLTSWFALVIAPHLQFGDQEPVTIEETGLSHPPVRPGDAIQGAEVYRAHGCQYCHTRQVRSETMGSDIARGWGTRRTAARDYIRDQPVMLGSMRIGPDLANVGARKTNASILLLQLYDPWINVPGSVMPSFAHLFDQRRSKLGATSSPDALDLPRAAGPAVEFEIIPGPDARALAAYLASQRSDAMFLEVFPPPAPGSTDAGSNR